jgi:hypothetical protein
MSFSGRRISIIKHDHPHDGHREKERRFSKTESKDLTEQGMHVNFPHLTQSK